MQVRCSSRSTREPRPWSVIVRAGMGTSAIVIPQEGRELARPALRRRIRDGVRPLAKERLNEALCRAVRAWRVGSRPQVAQREFRARGAKAARHIATPGVAHHPTDGKRARREPGHPAGQAGGAGGASLIGAACDIGAATVVIDRHVHILPPGTPTGAPAGAVHAMADRTNPSQRLDIDMQPIAGLGPRVASDGHLGHGRWPTEPQPPPPGAHGRPGPSNGVRHGPGWQAVLDAQLLDPRDHPCGCLMGGRAATRDPRAPRGRRHDRAGPIWRPCVHSRQRPLR